MHVFSVQAHLRIEAVKAPLVAQRRAGFARELIGEPEAGVVPCRGVFGARISEPDDQLDHGSSVRGGVPRCRKAEKKPAGQAAAGPVARSIETNREDNAPIRPSPTPLSPSPPP